MRICQVVLLGRDRETVKKLVTGEAANQQAAQPRPQWDRAGSLRGRWAGAESAAQEQARPSPLHSVKTIPEGMCNEKILVGVRKLFERVRQQARIKPQLLATSQLWICNVLSRLPEDHSCT